MTMKTFRAADADGTQQEIPLKDAVKEWVLTRLKKPTADTLHILAADGDEQKIIPLETGDVPDSVVQLGENGEIVGNSQNESYFVPIGSIYQPTTEILGLRFTSDFAFQGSHEEKHLKVEIIKSPDTTDYITYKISIDSLPLSSVLNLTIEPLQNNFGFMAGNIKIIQNVDPYTITDIEIVDGAQSVNLELDSSFTVLDFTLKKKIYTISPGAAFLTTINAEIYIIDDLTAFISDAALSRTYYTFSSSGSTVEIQRDYVKSFNGGTRSVVSANYFYRTFRACSSLESIDVSGVNYTLSEGEEDLYILYSFAINCISLKYVLLPPSLPEIPQSVKTIYTYNLAFSGCSKLEETPALPSFPSTPLLNINELRHMRKAFYQCSMLTTISCDLSIPSPEILPNLETLKYHFSYAFSETAVSELDLPGIVTTYENLLGTPGGTTTGDEGNMFYRVAYNCPNLVSASVGETWHTNQNDNSLFAYLLEEGFVGCPLIESITIGRMRYDPPIGYPSFGRYFEHMANSSSLKSLTFGGYDTTRDIAQMTAFLSSALPVIYGALPERHITGEEFANGFTWEF